MLNHYNTNILQFLPMPPGIPQNNIVPPSIINKELNSTIIKKNKSNKKPIKNKK